MIDSMHVVQLTAQPFFPQGAYFLKFKISNMCLFSKRYYTRTQNPNQYNSVPNQYQDISYVQT